MIFHRTAQKENKQITQFCATLRIIEKKNPFPYSRDTIRKLVQFFEKSFENINIIINVALGELSSGFGWTDSPDTETKRQRLPRREENPGGLRGLAALDSNINYIRLCSLFLSLYLFRYEAHKGGKFTREQLRRLVDPSNPSEKAAEASTTIGKCTSLNPCQATRLGEWWNRGWKWKSLETSYSFHRSPTFLLRHPLPLRPKKKAQGKRPLRRRRSS